MAGKELLEWKRARRDQTDLSNRRIFESRCQRYWVVESVGKFEGMGTVWYAISLTPHQQIISRHRGKNTAKRACETHLKKPKKRNS